MKAVLLILLITLMGSFQSGATAQAEPSWFPFPYPCDTEWIEGEKYYCETVYSEADLLSMKVGEQLKMKSRRFCRIENGAFTAISINGERGYLAYDGDYEPYQEYRIGI